MWRIVILPYNMSKYSTFVCHQLREFISLDYLPKSTYLLKRLNAVVMFLVLAFII